MTKFTQTAAAMWRLSRTAMEEASRCGQTETDLEHMLEALAVDEGTGGEALRAEGLTLVGVRAAVADQHAEQLRAIGVAASPPEPGPITFDGTKGYNWTPRAAAVFTRADKRRNRAATRRDPSAAFLRELVAEPSGQVQDLLARLGTSPANVLAQIDGRGGRKRTEAPTRSPGLTARRRAFVPAAPEEVWAFLADPARMPDWDPFAGAVEGLPAHVGPRPGATWTALARDRLPGGKPLRIDPAFRCRETRLVAVERPRRIAWAMHHPEAPRPAPQRLEIDLAQAQGGTLMTVTESFPAPSGWRRAAARVLRPLHRFAVAQHLGQVAGLIGRQFR